MASFLLVLIFILVFSAAALLSQALVPIFFAKYRQMQEKKVAEASKKLDNMFIDVERRKLSLFLVLTPLGLTIAAVLIYKTVIMGVVAGIVGILLPNLLIRSWEAKRKYLFLNQLLEGIMLISGCLKAGLSIPQAFEILVEDMSGPIVQEFSWVLKEVKMGVPLEESLNRLNKRMPSEELSLITNAILVASATGGNLAKVFARIAITIRDNRKLKNNIKTLTLQGRMQAIIMAILPFAFIWFVLTFNREHFDIMLKTEVGRLMLTIGAILLAVGLFLINKFSQLPEV
jgi:tight adherence protein B